MPRPRAKKRGELFARSVAEQPKSEELRRPAGPGEKGAINPALRASCIGRSKLHRHAAAGRASTIGAGLVNSEERAFLDATLPHLDVIYRVARHVSVDSHSAEDLVQETYLRAFAAFSTYRGGSAKAWLVTICLNLARSAGRRRSRRVAETALTGAPEPEAGGVSVPEEAFANIDRDSVSRALARVPEEQRLAIVLMDLAGHTASEVAEMLGRPRNTVLSWAHRGRRRLASLLVEEGVNRDVP